MSTAEETFELGGHAVTFDAYKIGGAVAPSYEYEWQCVRCGVTETNSAVFEQEPCEVRE